MMGQESRIAQSREFFVGVSSPVLTLQKIISEIAPTSIPVLLVGESGTGKEMFAHYIHEISQRRAESFVKIACASVNAESLAAELGHASVYHDDFQKSFGTLLFDEISELDAACQRILLYSLPDGEPKLRPGMIAARVISTTTKKLDEEIKSDRFRSELYYRLNGVCLRLPPLRAICKTRTSLPVAPGKPRGDVKPARRSAVARRRALRCSAAWSRAMHVQPGSGRPAASRQPCRSSSRRW